MQSDSWAEYDMNGFLYSSGQSFCPSEPHELGLHGLHFFSNSGLLNCRLKILFRCAHTL